jgi:aminoglycoside 6'-N-acetyltransferase I
MNHITPTDIRIIDLKTGDAKQLEEAAGVLHESFRTNWPDAWPTMSSAREEVEECTETKRICLAAVGTESSVIGWIGGTSSYDGKVWEIHPLCVHEAYRKRGIGAALVAALEEAVAIAGGVTIMLGTDDEQNQTTLGGVDLYDDLWSRIQNIQNLSGHPYTFYERLGFKIVGVVPDANGVGKPDIMMAKRVTNFPST